jgi:hypothetical protein
LINQEYEEAKIKATQIIPEIMDTLNCDEKMVFKMKHEKGMNIKVVKR